MANWSDPRTTGATFATAAGTRSAAYDAGLRSYMLSIYNYMASGVLLTGIVALAFAYSGLAEQVQGTPLRWIIALAPLGFVMVLSFGINRLSTAAAQMIFWAFAAVMGLSMSAIFQVYTGPSIAIAFVSTATAFLALSLYGYTTKRNLQAFGTFLIMGVVGLLVAMLLTAIFPSVRSPGLTMAINAIGVLLFAGLTAYDTQRIKLLYDEVAGTDMIGKAVIMGALSLYLDFINMFQFLLSLMGSRD